MIKKTTTCIICKKGELQRIPEFSQLSRLTSDCRPFNKGGEIAVCANCSLIQKIPDRKWLSEINQIYASYAAYSIAEGSEQLVMDSNTGLLSKRSHVIAKRLHEENIFSGNIDILDIGCGHGVTLEAFQHFFPEWGLYGHELDDSKLNHLSKIKNFQGLHTCDLRNVGAQFGLVTMVHSLEHFINPLETLVEIKNLVASGGYLFIQICNIDENPFDILIADHLTHFSPRTLAFTAWSAGYEVVLISKDWVKKEISALLRPANDQNNFYKYDLLGEDSFIALTKKNSWLKKLSEVASSQIIRGKGFGIFGTSIAGTWLANELRDRVTFFVDEDPNRIGKKYLKRDIISPESIPDDAIVFLAMAPQIARQIAIRLRELMPGIQFIEPPPENW